MALPKAPLMIKLAATVISTLNLRLKIKNPKYKLTPKAKQKKKYFCQPPASAKKLNAAPGL